MQRRGIIEKKNFSVKAMFRRSIPFKSDGIFSMVADSRHREKTFKIEKKLS